MPEGFPQTRELQSPVDCERGIAPWPRGRKIPPAPFCGPAVGTVAQATARSTSARDIAVAVREMIRLPGELGNMHPADAYALCSLAVHLHVTQVVHGVNGVHAMLRKSLLR